MTWYQEINPYFIVSRISGLFPFSFINGKIVQSKCDYVYALVAIICRLATIIYRLFWQTTFDIRQFQLGVLIFASTGLAWFVLFLECFIGLVNFARMEVVTDLIGKFDDAVGINFATWKLAVWNWFIILIAPLFIIVIDQFSYSITRRDGLVLFVLFFESTAAWYYMVMKFLAIVVSLGRRFRHLRELLITGFKQREIRSILMS